MDVVTNSPNLPVSLAFFFSSKFLRLFLGFLQVRLFLNQVVRIFLVLLQPTQLASFPVV